MALNPKSSTFRHTIAWVLWLGWETRNYFTAFPTYSATELLLIFYNYISLVVVFYSIVFVLKGYFMNISWPRFWEMRPGEKMRYLAKYHILILPLVCCLYLLASVLMDRAFSLYPYDTISDHLDTRWYRVKFYVAGAIMYALYNAGKAKHKEEKLAMRKQIGELIASAFNVNELQKKYANKDKVN